MEPNVLKPSAAHRPPSTAPLAGTAYCIAAAFLYTVSNICLRKLAGGGDILRVIAVRESMTPLCIGPWLALCAWRGQTVLPRGWILLLLILTGLATQWIGNIGFFWALGIIGLAIGIPVVVGGTIMSATLLGKIFLGEQIRPRSLLALAVLMTSIVLLNLGAGQANHVIAIHAPILNGPFWVTSAILITCAAGLVFGLLSLSIRIAVTKGITPEAAVTAIAICGPLSLAPIAIFRSGLEHCLTMSGHDFSLTLANGLFNTAAFLCLSRGLQRTTILHANMVNASQIAMAAVAGVLLFAEPLTGALLSGALLTMIGVVLVARPMATVPAASTFSRAEVPGPSLSVPTAALMEKEI